MTGMSYICDESPHGRSCRRTYFSLADMKNKMGEIDEHLRTMLRVVIWKRWKTPRKRAWGLRKLGISDGLTKRTSVCGNRYQWMVTKTCIVRAISKRIG